MIRLTIAGAGSKGTPTAEGNTGETRTVELSSGVLPTQSGVELPLGVLPTGSGVNVESISNLHVYVGTSLGDRDTTAIMTDTNGVKTEIVAKGGVGADHNS